MPNLFLSPVPNRSKISDKEGNPLSDWVRWFNDVHTYCTRLLNKYETNLSGLATLVAGVVVVANTSITANSIIRLTPQNNSGTPGHISITLNAGVGFTLTSTSLIDTRTIFYEIVEAF